MPLNKFYAAEDYHQNFIARNPNQAYVVRHDPPKLAQLRQHFPSLIKKGHVFEDGPNPTGLRYCMNGVAMKFIPA